MLFLRREADRARVLAAPAVRLRVVRVVRCSSVFIAALCVGGAYVPDAALAQSAADAVVLAQGAAREEASQEAPATFTIAAIDVSGVTKLSNAEIETLIYPHLGPNRSNEDVIAAQRSLRAAYAKKGFEAVEVEVPVQPNETFIQGIVQIVVHEAPLGKVQVVDAKHHSAEKARAQVPSLVDGQPINIASLQHDVAEANRFPDRQISPKFKPGAAPGTVDVDLQVEDNSPIHASAELNNDNSPNNEPLRRPDSQPTADICSEVAAWPKELASVRFSSLKPSMSSEACGMTVATVRHCGKRTRAYTVAARVADNVTAIPLSKMGR